MTVLRLILRSLTHYWRTNVAVVLGVATAVAVLSGALLVGDSVRGSLRGLVLERLGRTEQVVLSSTFFREQLADDIQQDSAFSAGKVAPMTLAQGFVSVQGGDGRAGKVAIYGIDERFWNFHGLPPVPLEDREVLLSPALASELKVEDGKTVLIRTQNPTDIPMESLHGRKDDAVRTVRATVRSVLPRETLGEFSLQAQQGTVRAVFLPLTLVQRELGVGPRVNTLLVSGITDTGAIEEVVRKHATLEDLGLRLRDVEGFIALESASGLLEDATADAARAVAAEVGLPPQGLFTYLANTMRIGNRELPYSVVTAMDSLGLPAGSPPVIALNDWAARDLGAKPGDNLTMEYFLWEEPGQLVTRTADFRVDRIVPLATGDHEMTPVYPGITDTSSLRDWDPPFPIDLRRIRPVDEDYWDKHSTTPKAFISLQEGQKLWRSRYGSMTSIRLKRSEGNPEAQLADVASRLRGRIDPLRSGLAVQDVRGQSLDASRGATNFGEYFVYFSFFLVISAILLAALFFKLSVEQRIREVGLLRALGLSPAAVRRVFLGEGLGLSLIGAILGAAGGLLYAAAILFALRTWWIGAIGTESISLHVSPLSMILGAAGGVAAALLCIAVTLRSLRRVSDRSLLAGQLEAVLQHDRGKRSSLLVAGLLGGMGLLLLGGGIGGWIDQTASFFGGGLLLLVAILFLVHYRLSQPSRTQIGSNTLPLPRLGFRNASFRPSRSIVAVATIASATFILISVDSFRKGEPDAGIGGFTVLAETLIPIAHDPNTKEGREALGLTDLESIHFEAFRVRPGDDASCLNLYEPKNPRILAPPENFIESARFAFRSSLATTEAEQENPWLLLRRSESDGSIPVIADANSMTYVLHRKIGEDFVIMNRGQEVRLRFVAALSDSIFQSELLMSPENFLKLFPEQDGYSFLLARSSGTNPESLSEEVESALTAYGADATPTAARLAEFHRVENTYLSTFQMLGGLGLLLGTVGLGAVLVRSIFERRRELALLRTLGYEGRHFFIMTLMENALLLGGGVLAGTSCALLAIAPAATRQGGQFPTFALAILLGVLLVVGIAVSLLSTKVALREAVLPALRSE